MNQPARSTDRNLGWRLCAVLLALVAAFVLLSELTPQLMSRPVTEGNALTLGFVLGIVDVIVVIGVAWYFEHRLNARDKSAAGKSG